MAESTKRRRTVIITSVVALLVIAAGAGIWFATRPTSSAAENAAQQTSTVQAAVTTQRETVSASGTISPRTQSNLNFGVAGTVTQVSAQVGAKVRKGDVLARIDDSSLQDSLKVAQANVDAASANDTQVHSSRSATQAQLASADAQLTSAQAKRDAARDALGQATLTSPIDGTVAVVNVNLGDKVTASQNATGSSGSSGSTNSGGSGGSGQGSSGGSGGSGQGGSGGSAQGSSGQGSSGQGSSGQGSSSATQSAQVVVIATDAWNVTASVNSSDLARIQPGMQAEITPSGSQDKVFGVVSSVGVMATSSGGTTGFPVTIAVTGSPAGLYAGGPADVSIVVKQLTDILTVPTAAISTENGQTVVHQTKDGKQVSTVVGVGEVFGQVTQITSGLNEGDDVIVTARSYPRASASPGSRTGGGGYGGGGSGGGFGGQGQGRSNQGGGAGQAPTRNNQVGGN